MKVVYTGEPFPDSVTKSIFLAGPTPRSADVKSWRPKALEILEKLNYDGFVFIPEFREGSKDISDLEYVEQIAWETKGLNRADVIIFWVPRNLTIFPALTTNIEWGIWANSGKAVFGAPIHAEKNRYLEKMADRLSVPVYRTLEGTLIGALEIIGDGAQRIGGECDIPLHIWRTHSFRMWYQNQKLAGNRLDGAEVLWSHRTGPDKQFVACWIVKANIHVTAENRNKTNEFVIARSDIVSVLLWYENLNPLESEVVLVKEFRSPARTPDGFIHELPGGSSLKVARGPKEVALTEIKEETDATFESKRLLAHGSRQSAGTFSSHHAHLFSIKLTREEIKYFRETAQRGVTFGNEKDSEKTYIEVKTLQEILDNRLLDWSTMGMIFQVIMEGR